MKSKFRDVVMNLFPSKQVFMTQCPLRPPSSPKHELIVDIPVHQGRIEGGVFGVSRPPPLGKILSIISMSLPIFLTVKQCLFFYHQPLFSLYMVVTVCHL